MVVDNFQVELGVGAAWVEVEVLVEVRVDEVVVGPGVDVEVGINTVVGGVGDVVERMEDVVEVVEVVVDVEDENVEDVVEDVKDAVE